MKFRSWMVCWIRGPWSRARPKTLESLISEPRRLPAVRLCAFQRAPSLRLGLLTRKRVTCLGTCRTGACDERDELCQLEVRSVGCCTSSGSGGPGAVSCWRSCARCPVQRRCAPNFPHGSHRIDDTAGELSWLEKSVSPLHPNRLGDFSIYKPHFSMRFPYFPHQWSLRRRLACRSASLRIRHALVGRLKARKQE